LDGFYGTKLKSSADLVIEGEFNVPIYAQWKYGKGMVGSFMCDLNGTWSGKFMSDPNGRQLIVNVVRNLMPVSNIRPNEISVALKEYNYINQMSVFAGLAENEKVVGEIVKVDGTERTPISLNEVNEVAEGESDAILITQPLGPANAYTRLTLIVKERGVYKITLNKLNAKGETVATYQSYKTFSYSKEYDTYVDPENRVDYEALMARWAERGEGVMVEDVTDPYEVFESFITEIHKVFDPRFIFIIIAIILFLLDICVRKFKFKWPHEIIRDYREKKNKK